MSISLQPVKGTRDFYPAEMRLRNWLFDLWRRCARAYGFEEYDACVLESEELYVRKAGDEITEQLYSFEDKGGRRLALRPEMTPSLARLILQRQSSLTFPLKWFSIPQCFRYERMTRGRKREHYQWNADVIGQPGITAEVEVLGVLLSSLQAMGLTPEHVSAHLNDRRLLNAVLDHLDVPAEQHLPVMVVMDKRDKISPDQLATQLEAQGLDGAQIEKLNAFLRMETLEEFERHLGEVEAIRHLRELMRLLEETGFGGYAVFDITVVRGLSYYTGTVFEIRDRGANLRAICGGGRYDSLLSAFGGESIAAIGFGFGDVVILELLEDLGLLPDLADRVDYAVIPFSEAELTPALRVAEALRAEGWRVHGDYTYRKLRRALQRADEIGAARAVLVLPDELAEGQVVLRDMSTREERRVPLAELTSGGDAGAPGREAAAS